MSVTLNQSPTPGRLSFFSFPEIQETATISGNQIIITPTSPLEKNIIYSYSITDTQTNEIVKSGEFSTGGIDAIRPLQGRYANLDTVADNAQKIQHPDIFLSNQTPYASLSFSIISTFTPSPTGHYYFTVSLLAEKTFAKNAFLSWVKNLGLTDQQISSLDITYK